MYLGNSPRGSAAWYLKLGNYSARDLLSLLKDWFPVIKRIGLLSDRAWLVGKGTGGGGGGGGVGGGGGGGCSPPQTLPRSAPCHGEWRQYTPPGTASPKQVMQMEMNTIEPTYHCRFQ